MILNNPISQAFLVLLKEHRQQPIRLLVIIFAMAVGCAGLTAVLIINDAAKQSYRQASQPLVSNVNMVIAPKNGEHITKADYANLRKRGYVNLVAVAQRQVVISAQHSVQVLGIDYFAIMSLAQLAKTNQVSTFADIGFSKSTRYLVHPNFKKRLVRNADLNGQFLTLQDIKLGPVSDYAGNGMGDQLVADISVVFEDFPDSRITYLMVIGHHQNMEQLSASLPTHLYIKELVTGENAEELTGSFHMNLLAMGLLMFVVCLFVIMNALHLLMSKRVAMFKILRQMGVTIGELSIATLLEALVISTLSCIAGIFIGMWFASILSPAVNQTLANLYQVNVGFNQLSLLEIFIQCWLASVIGVITACILPLKQISRELTKLVAVSSKRQSDRLWFGLSFLLFALAGLMYAWVNSVLGAFSIITLVIFSGCFLVLAATPWLLNKLAKTISSYRPIAHWSSRDALRVSNKSNIALCAFFIAVVANIGMNLMVNSFRGATEDWITQRLDADAYIYTNQANQVKRWLRQNNPEIEAFIRRQEMGVFEQKNVEIRSFPISTGRQNSLIFDSAKKDVWDMFIEQDGALINQQFALSKDIRLGQPIDVHTETLGQQTYTVAGIYLDYGNPNPQLLLPPEKVKAPEAGRNIIALYLADHDSLDRHLEQLIAAFPDEFEQSDLLRTSDLLTLSMATFDRTFVITHGLNIITLLVAAFSLATSVLIIDRDNAPQRALIKSIGVSANKLLVTTMTQYSLLCLVVCLLATPFGIGLSWLLINLVNVHAFHWSYALHIDPSIVFNIVVVSIALILVIVFIPALKSAKTPLLSDIKRLQQ